MFVIPISTFALQTLFKYDFSPLWFLLTRKYLGRECERFARKDADTCSTTTVYSGNMPSCWGILFDSSSFFRRAAASSGGNVPIDHFCQTDCCHITGTWSSWKTFSDNMFPVDQITHIFSQLFPMTTCRLQRMEEWLTVLFPVMGISFLIGSYRNRSFIFLIFSKK